MVCGEKENLWLEGNTEQSAGSSSWVRIFTGAACWIVSPSGYLPPNSRCWFLHPSRHLQGQGQGALALVYTLNTDCVNSPPAPPAPPAPSFSSTLRVSWLSFGLSFPGLQLDPRLSPFNLYLLNNPSRSPDSSLSSHNLFFFPFPPPPFGPSGLFSLRLTPSTQVVLLKCFLLTFSLKFNKTNLLGSTRTIVPYIEQ